MEINQKDLQPQSAVSLKEHLSKGNNFKRQVLVAYS